MLNQPLDFDHFCQLAENYNVIPVIKSLMADLLTPVSAYLRLKDLHHYSFLLESITGGENLARYSFIGFRPNLILRSSNGTVIKVVEDREEFSAGDYLAILRDYFRNLKPASLEGLPPFTGGAVGYLSYDIVRWFEKIPDKNAPLPYLDDACMIICPTILAFDHVKQQITIIVNTFTNQDNESLKKIYTDALTELAEIEKLLSQPLPATSSATIKKLTELESNMTKAEFESAVEKAKEYIKSGDIFQIVLSQRFEMQIEGDPFQLYRALRTLNPSPYMFYLKLDETILIGSSPELLVRCYGEDLEYRPIAGTRPRGKTALEDQRLSKELLSDEKELAEHVMLVDLGRNDLGRVAEIGSVEVPQFMVIEKYSHVMHIVSSLKAKLRPESDCFDALASCFPAGTVSGAPKVRAMEIIDQLEPTRRGPYAGAVLYLDFSGNLDSCIAIRTFVIHQNRLFLQAGAGIVADSLPHNEYQETINKATALLRALDLLATM